MGKDSTFDDSNSNNIIVGNKLYRINTFEEFLPKEPKSWFNKFIHYLLFKLKQVYDLLHGIESGYKMCCIRAFLSKRTQFIWGINYALCESCFKKALKNGGEPVNYGNEDNKH